MENVQHLHAYLHFEEANRHRLRSIEGNDFDPDEGNERRCAACTFPIFSTPYESHQDARTQYRFLHKCCAELPEVVMDHPLHQSEPLRLHKKQRGYYSRYHHRRHIVCNHCKVECKGFFYQCPTDACRFTLDIKCATQVKILHRSHKHQLTLLAAEKDHICYACGLAHSGELTEFYWCYFCKVYLHRDCASLPNMILHKNHVVDGQQHPLALTYTVPRNSYRFKRLDKCSICPEKLSLMESGIYFCTKCEYSAHIKCATSRTSLYNPVAMRDIISGLPHLPMKDEHTSLIPYLQNMGCIKTRPGSDSIEDEKKFLKENIHDHDLILYEECSDDDESAAPQLSNLCNACIEPISGPFYSCPQCNDFYLHRCCANLPLQFPHPAHKCKHDRTPLQLHPRLESCFTFKMWCEIGCNQFNNGFLYGCDTCGFHMDVKCALLPEAVTYEFHGKSHILFLSHNKDYDRSSSCNCCSYIMSLLYYECGSCPNFKIHARCILLPPTVSHKYDRHPLNLTPFEQHHSNLTPFKASTSKDRDEEFCEICESGFDTRFPERFYHCKECITSFHINCIPCVGKYAKIKFGKTIRVRCHECPLTCIRLLNSYNYTCGLCHRAIKGGYGEHFYEEPGEHFYGRGQPKYERSTAFECIKCGYWLDYDCAIKNIVDD